MIAKKIFKFALLAYSATSFSQGNSSLHLTHNASIIANNSISILKHPMATYKNSERLSSLDFDITALETITSGADDDILKTSPIKISIEPFPGEKYDYIIDSYYKNQNIRSWSGPSAREEEGFISISTDGEYVTAQMSYGFKFFKLYSNKNNRAIAREEPQPRGGMCGSHHLVDLPKNSSKASPHNEIPERSKYDVINYFTRQKSNTAHIKLLITYSQETQNYYGPYIQTAIANLVSTANQSFSASGMSVNLSASSITMLPGSNGGTSNTQVPQAASFLNTYQFAYIPVRTLRNQYSADLVVHLMTNNGQSAYCGAAPTRDLLNNGENTFGAVVRVDCEFDEHTFTHEIGHLLGVQHSSSAPNGPIGTNWTPSQFQSWWNAVIWDNAFGYTKTDGSNVKFRTIMGDGSTTGPACSSPCVRINRWSNPFVNTTIGGVSYPLGYSFIDTVNNVYRYTWSSATISGIYDPVFNISWPGTATIVAGYR